jgi:hypothetical protein
VARAIIAEDTAMRRHDGWVLSAIPLVLAACGTTPEMLPRADAGRADTVTPPPPPPDATGGGDAGMTATGCSASGLLFCEDFESYAVGPASSARWRTSTSSASSTLAIESEAMHARGSRSLHVHANANEFSYIRVSSLTPPGNSFFGRVYAYVTAFPSAPGYAHWTMVEASGTPDGAGVIRPIGGQYDPTGRAADWGVGSDGGPTGDWCNWNTRSPAQAGRWICLEWELRANGTTINVWIDNVAQTWLTVTPASRDGLVFPQFNSVWFGWWLYQPSPTPSSFDLWLDDIVLGTTRVGC